jgi:small conductance mechanosensitive channel
MGTIQEAAALSPEFWDPVLKELLLYLPRIGAGLAVFLGFWLGAAFTRRLIERVGRSRRIDPDVMSLLANSCRIGLILFGAVSGLGTLGINVAGMVAGLGLAGLALSLALKEIVSNALSGVLILIYKPFRRNDRIAVLTFQGKVIEVNLRFTAIEGSGGKVFIPNTLLLTNALVVGTGEEMPRPAPAPPPWPTT